MLKIVSKFFMRFCGLLCFSCCYVSCFVPRKASFLIRSARRRYFFCSWHSRGNQHGRTAALIRQEFYNFFDLYLYCLWLEEKLTSRKSFQGGLSIKLADATRNLLLFVLAKDQRIVHFHAILFSWYLKSLSYLQTPHSLMDYGKLLYPSSYCSSLFVKNLLLKVFREELRYGANRYICRLGLLL